jgi:HEAT repeat protein
MISGNVDPLRPFLNGVTHPEASVRVETAIILGQISEPASCRALFQLLLDSDPRVQDAALHSLVQNGRYPENRVAQQAVHFLGDDRYDVQMRVRSLLTALGNQSLHPLISELQSPVPLHRRQAAEILGVLGESDASGALMEALRDGDPNVVSAAGQALGRLKVKQSVDHIIAAYRLYPEMGHIFAEALGHIASGNAISFLITRLSMASGLEAFAITEALGEIGRPQAMDSLLVMLSTAEGMLLEMLWRSILTIAQKNQMDILALLGSAQVQKRLQDIFQDDEQDLLSYLTQALRETSTTRGILILATRFHRFPPQMRRVLAQELGRIGGRGAVNCLTKALEDEDVLVVYQAAESLARIGGEAAESALKHMLDSGNEVHMLAAVRALKHIQVNPFLERLHQLLAHDNPSIHQAVRQTLSACSMEYRFPEKELLL